MNNQATIPTDPTTLAATKTGLIDQIIDQISMQWRAQCILIYGSEDGWEVGEE